MPDHLVVTPASNLHGEFFIVGDVGNDPAECGQVWPSNFGGFYAYRADGSAISSDAPREGVQPCPHTFATLDEAVQALA